MPVRDPLIAVGGAQQDGLLQRRPFQKCGTKVVRIGIEIDLLTIGPSLQGEARCKPRAFYFFIGA
jgi:hypothetical protein